MYLHNEVSQLTALLSLAEGAEFAQELKEEMRGCIKD
jgi:hypothetical protein